MMEYLIKYILFPGKVEQWTVFVDMGKKWFEGININNIEKVFDTFQSYYPCRLYKIFIFNPPSFFPKLMKLFSDYVSPDVLDKVVIEKERSIPKTF